MNKKTKWMQVTEEESELLAAIRNYNKSFPDGYPQLLWYAQQLFDNMLRQPYLWKQNLPSDMEGRKKDKSSIKYE